MLNQKTFLMWLVLSSSVIVTVGCGKNKESRGPAPEAQAEKPVQSDEGAPTTPAVQDPQTDLQAPQSPGAPSVPGVPPVLVPQLPQAPQLPEVKTDGPVPLPKSGDLNAGTLPPLPISSAGEVNQNGDTSVIKPPLVKSKKENLALAAKFDEIEAVKTGAKSDKLNYTSSGSDGLMAEFRGYNNKVNAEQKTMNLNLAKAIISAKIKRSTGSGDILVNLTLDESLDGVKKITSYQLKATLEESKYSLSKVSSNGDLEVQGGFLKCTDIDGGCENAYIKIKMSGAYARVIFRNSYADRFFVLQNGSQGSNFELWKTYLNNSVSGDMTSKKLDYVQVSSYEVVNGRSGMGVMIVTEDKELVGLSVPLLANDKGTSVSALVTKLSDLSKNYDLVALNGAYAQNLSAAISNVKLVNNNGKGDLRLLMDLSTGPAKAAMAMTLSRVQKATLSIAEIKGFEDAVPKF